MLSENALLDFSIRLNGTEADLLSVFQIEVTQELFEVPTATFSISGALDDLAAFEKETKDLKVGADIEIRIGYDGKQEPVFTGNITSRRTNLSEYAVLTVMCQDASTKTSLISKTADHIDKTGGEVIAEIAGDNGLASRVAANGEAKHEVLAQVEETDWDFMGKLARSTNKLLYADKGTIVLESPNMGASPALKITPEYLMGVEIEEDGEVRYGSLQTIGHNDFGLNKVVELQGLGSLDGNLLVTALHYVVEDGEWSATVQFNAPLS